MIKKYFPIQTDTSCRLKWSWSTLFINTGYTSSCHRASKSQIPDNFENFHNTAEKVNARNTMLQGKWPNGGCEYCREVEQAGGTSDRQFQNQIPNIYPPELDSNHTLTEVVPTILEVFFSNTCNLSCVYCNAKFSSSIQAEDAKFGGAIIAKNNFVYSDNQYKKNIPKFWNWFSQNSNSLQRLQILGGEPFLQREVLQLIDYLKLHPNPNLELNFITNLNVPTEKFKEILQKLHTLQIQRKVKRIDIQVSIDCWGESQEYIRYGFDMELFEQNMNHMLDLKIFRIGLLSTITSLSIPTMSILAEKYNKWCEKQKIFWYMHLVLPNNESYFDPTIFDYQTFDVHLKHIRQKLPDNNWDDKKSLEIFDGIISKLVNNCKTDINRQQQLKNYLKTNDIRRKSNWKDNFVWLEKHFKENNVV
jgi:MoaA/NifB/PqqE/SkfB family radical SAM enzyme